MNYPRILTVQDISCVGQCSLTVALPILSACGAESCPLPSAVLSTHTAGFHNFTFRDLTDDMPAIAAHWQSEGIRFDAIYTGYLGSTRQIGYVRELFANAGTEACVRIVDPAMADNGRLYPAFDAAFVEDMRSLLPYADYLLPNITEAALLAGMPYRESYGEDYVRALCEALCALGAKTVVLTGVSYDAETTGVAVWDGALRYYRHEKLSRGCHGTGDVYASAFTGALLRGHEVLDAARIAADFTVSCIRFTSQDESHWYGVKFEPLLGELMAKL